MAKNALEELTAALAQAAKAGSKLEVAARLAAAKVRVPPS